MIDISRCQICKFAVKEGCMFDSENRSFACDQFFV